MRRNLFAILLVPVLAPPAGAQTYGNSTYSGGAVGNVATNGTAQTIFRVNASTGTVTVNSGSASRLSTGAANVTVTVSCSGGGCNSDLPRVTVSTSGTTSGRAAALQNFTVASGTATVSSVSGTNPLTFRLTAIGNNSSKTFRLGFDLPIDGSGSAASTGNATSGFTVLVQRATGTAGQNSTSSLVSASVFRGVAISNGSNLVFGKIVRPSAGSGSVSVNTSGTRTLTGALGFSSPTPAAADFSVTGEGGQSVTVTVPASFTMTNGANPAITVTTTNTGGGSQVLSGTLGSAGSLAVKVGGSFNVTSTTPTGIYSGSFTVSVQYN